LQLKNIIRKESKTYLLLNFTGATFAWISSIFILFYPFVTLEGTWAAVSLFPFFKKTQCNFKNNTLLPHLSYQDFFPFFLWWQMMRIL